MTGLPVVIDGNTFTGNNYNFVNKGNSELDPTVTNSFDVGPGGTQVNLEDMSESELFALQNTIVDAIDVSGYGLVRLKAGNVYVTPNSYFPVGGTTAPSIQRTVDVAVSPGSRCVG